MILLLLVFFSTSRLESSEEVYPFSLYENVKTVSIDEPEKKTQTIYNKISQDIFCFGAGTVLGATAFIARAGWALSQVSPWALNIGNECLLLSHLSSSASKHLLGYLFKRSSSNKVLPSQYSWLLNQEQLSKIPIFSNEEKNLVHFLEKRWLAKSTGFFPIIADWICPTFGVSLQTHPETSHFYARSPLLKISEPYKNRVNAWKTSLPHPQHFPLILTRPFDIHDYLPNCLSVLQNEAVETTVEKLALKLQSGISKVVVDVTQVFMQGANTSQQWLETWNDYQAQFSQNCKDHKLNPNQILCIHQVQQEHVGGIRILPFEGALKKEMDLQHQYLLEWISTFGLSANRIELDRWPATSKEMTPEQNDLPVMVKLPPKDEFVAFLQTFEKNWKSDNAQKNLMVSGTMKVLKGLFASISEENWEKIRASFIRSSATQLSMFQIKEQLKQLLEEKEDALFFTTVSHLEQIHSSLSALLEIGSPFTPKDFPPIYHDVLTCIPLDLKPLTSYGVHSAGMTSMAGIFKAVEKTIGKTPRVIYGENTYYECINATMLFSNAVSILDAKKADWEDVDLLIAQFNPVLKRIDFTVTNYGVENVAETLHHALRGRDGRALTLVLDCTLDFIDSPRVASLLNEFQEEIKTGALNIVCIRSGIKFDIFGMDNYCGAPFFMIHNKDPKWTFYDSLLTDKVLQTDLLSLNWFCLAYQNAAPELTQYQKQIVDNTRDLLNKIPPRLFDLTSSYRIVPVEQEADPAFIDIKISGPLHQLRGAVLASGCLYLKCMEEGHPIFYRLSLGFSHPNFAVLFSENGTTIRLTLGLDPAQVDVLANCFEMIDALNGSPGKALFDRFQNKQPTCTLTYSKAKTSF